MTARVFFIGLLVTAVVVWVVGTVLSRLGLMRT